MLRRTFLTVLTAGAVAAFMPGGARASGSPLPGFDEALAAGEPILVHVTAPWCSVCRAQKKVLPGLLENPDFAALRVFEVDFDSQDDILAYFRVQSQSTMIVFRDGAEIDRQVGQSDPAVIEALLRQAI